MNVPGLSLEQTFPLKIAASKLLHGYEHPQRSIQGFTRSPTASIITTFRPSNLPQHGSADSEFEASPPSEIMGGTINESSGGTVAVAVPVAVPVAGTDVILGECT